MSDDWRVRRATELFGGPFPPGSDGVLPLSPFDRRPGDAPGRRGGDAGRRSDDAPVAGPAVVATTRTAVTPMAWPWRWRILTFFLLVQTGLIIWLVVLRTAPVQRVVVVTAPGAAPSATASAPSSDLIESSAPVGSGVSTTAPVPREGDTAEPRDAAPVTATRASPARTPVPAKPHAPPSPHARTKAAPKNAPAVPLVVTPVSSCVPGSSPATRNLCADPTMRRFDEERQAAFAQVVAHGDSYLTGLARQQQAHFLRRRDKCADDACLTRVYTDFIVALVKLLPAGSATPPICMPQQYTRAPLMNCWPSHLRDVRKPFYSK